MQFQLTMSIPPPPPPPVCLVLALIFRHSIHCPPICMHHWCGDSVPCCIGTPPLLSPSNTHVQATLGVGGPSIFALLILAVCFSICSTVCHVCFVNTLVLRCTLFIFCVKAALLAKRTAACDQVEISGNFDRWMSQQYCEWISDKVDERKLSDKSPIPCPDHQEFANMVAAVCAQTSSQSNPQTLHPNLQQSVMHRARKISTFNSSRCSKA